MRSWILGSFLVAACGSDEASDPDAAIQPDADTGACATPLDTATLDALTHSFWAVPSVEIQPGMQRDLELGVVELGGAFSAMPACATWSIAPATGAAVDATTGVVHVDAATPPGTEYVVTADVESGRKLISADVFVYLESEMPWHGTWREEAEYACGSGAEVAPEETLNEIHFWADGTIWVTWLPFEVYVDYWGAYAFDAGAGTVTVAAEGGNYVPDDIDGTGTFTFTGGALVLRDLWLGSPQNGTGPARCGHRLIR